MVEKPTEDERRELLDIFAPLRVADVSDGLDWNLMHDRGHISQEIRPIYRPVQFCGLAKTARYVPTDREVPEMTPQEYTEFSSHWYAEVCPYPFRSELEEGDVLCIDASNTDVGLLGSNNVLSYINQGVRGVVTNGGCRDTDEIIQQQCPVFCRHISRTMVQGRLEYAGMMEPVEIGGVLVHPYDIVVADGDGVIVVPLKKAREVAKYARQELKSDKKSRRRLYREAGMELDDTVK